MNNSQSLETNKVPIKIMDNGTSTNEEHVCKLVLYMEVPSINVRVWDVVILIPNLIFMIYLATKFNRARLKLRAANSPIFFTFYCLVLFNVLTSIMRCLISMTLDFSNMAADSINIALWILVKCFFLATEMSVVVFALAFGHMESRSSIRYVLITTSFISLAYSASQGALEMFVKDSIFRVNKDLNLFGHGGVIFWLISSVIFTMLYLLILLLPMTRLREKLALPVNRSFYVYVALLALLNSIGSIGCSFLLVNITEGLCIVDVTTFLYFTLFTPLVYVTFLSTFFSVSQSSIMFSYKAQNDDRVEEDTVSLPHQPSFSSLKTDSDYIYQADNVYNNTRFSVNDRQNIANPLYNASLQSPDSITGYSMDEQTIDVEQKK